MKQCDFCGEEFIPNTSGQKFCSYNCKEEKHKERMRMRYVGKREQACVICGADLPKRKTRYCSDRCRSRAGAIRAGTVLDHGLLTKKCPVCGKEFQTFKSMKITCSSECSRIRKKKRPDNRNKEKKRIYDHEKYLRKHPDALTAEERRAERKKAKNERETQRKKAQIEREAERAKTRAEKEKIKQANIAYWLEYEAEHECAVCGEKFVAHYPTTKYCSEKCRKINTKPKKRYKGITIDSGISLFKLAKRDNNQCQICGLQVNWDDRWETDKAIICGDMYPSIDHIRPISLGGLHSWNNVQLAHRGCNTRKRNNYIG